LGTLGALGEGRGGVGTAVIGEACCVDCACGAAVGMAGDSVLPHPAAKTTAPTQAARMDM